MFFDEGKEFMDTFLCYIISVVVSTFSNMVLENLGIYVAMALAGRFICSMTGIDCTGGFDPSLDAIVEGLGYAAPPIMALLFILDVWHT